MSTPPPIPPDEPKFPQAPPPYTPAPPPYDPTVVSPKSTMSGGTKALLFGCLGLVAVMLVAVVVIGVWAWNNAKPFMVEQILKAHPEFESVRVDKDSQTIMLRDKASGEVLTARMDRIMEGKLIITKSDGTEIELGPERFKMKGQGGFQATFGSAEAVPLPDWVPPYPGQHSVALSTQQESNGSLQGVRTVLTADDVPAARDAYLKALENAGYTLKENNDLTVDGHRAVNLKAVKSTDAGLTQTAVVAITALEGKTQVGLTYDQSPAEK